MYTDTEEGEKGMLSLGMVIGVRCGILRISIENGEKAKMREKFVFQ